MSIQTYQLAEPDVICEKFQEGVILLNLSTGQYFDVGERYIPLLEAIETRTDIQYLAGQIEQIETGASHQMHDAISKLVSFGLIRESNESGLQCDPEFATRLLQAGNHYFIENYDDLAALFAADPVHDIDPKSGKIAN